MPKSSEGQLQYARRYNQRKMHGTGIELWFARQWEQQEGRCYLCGDELAIGRAHIDHDYRCCPQNRSCSRCRRGLACPGCNQLVGLGRDDPDRIRRIADNLSTAKGRFEMANNESINPPEMTLTFPGMDAVNDSN